MAYVLLWKLVIFAAITSRRETRGVHRVEDVLRSLPPIRKEMTSGLIGAYFIPVRMYGESMQRRVATGMYHHLSSNAAQQKVEIVKL